ncbi:PadR family transcriptional regulator [Acrocarpospora phusangensis]|uniref:PadR family transcriptional regulator n=1 Tax=Acrocarpospora phusangensis TaxID=1070424 RepID=A0A919Q7R0_9ACTN|nr:PadR family transcriptional regulator [Acrocarpospora phusangensis]GIH23999.1 PadR family transcriptional regulator [Acrocarpospora phusangensis]
MAKRRKVANLMALAVLSSVAVRPMHPYEMAAALRGWNKDHDMGIKWGSLYTVVGNLARHGLIEEVESSRQGRRPERTVYRITEAGRAEMIDWTRELLSVPHAESPRFRAGLSVMAVLGPDEVIALLTERLAELDRQVADLKAAHEAHSAEVPRLFLIEMEYDLVVLEAETAWVRALLGELTGGAFPGLREWRTFHETGEMPDDLRELAEKKIN